jgi:hypothetical protein
MSSFSQDISNIQLIASLFSEEDRGIPSNLQEKNGRVVIKNKGVDFHETFLKIKYFIREGQPFNTLFNETDTGFLSDSRNNKRIAKFLIDCCNILTEKIQYGAASLEECQEIMSSAANQFSSGSSPAHVAAAVGDLPLAHLLVIYGFSLDQENERGFTPRMMFEIIHGIECPDIEVSSM